MRNFNMQYIYITCKRMENCNNINTLGILFNMYIEFIWKAAKSCTFTYVNQVSLDVVAVSILFSSCLFFF